MMNEAQWHVLTHDHPACPSSNVANDYRYLVGLRLAPTAPFANQLRLNGRQMRNLSAALHAASSGALGELRGWLSVEGKDGHIELRREGRGRFLKLHDLPDALAMLASQIDSALAGQVSHVA